MSELEHSRGQIGAIGRELTWYRVGKRPGHTWFAHNGQDTWNPSKHVPMLRDRSKLGAARKAASDAAFLAGDDELGAILAHSPKKVY